MVRATPAPGDGMWLTPSNVCCGFAGAVDKRGRALARDAGAQELSKLYRVEGNDDAPENVDIEGKARATATRDIIMNKKLERLNAMARGEIAFEGSSSDDDSDSRVGSALGVPALAKLVHSCCIACRMQLRICRKQVGVVTAASDQEPDHKSVRQGV